MARIAVICARPHANPGMYSVDLAVERVLRRHAVTADVERYCYGGPHRATGLDRHELRYRSLVDGLDAVLDADLILYWGDYLHAYTYWRNALHIGPNRDAGFVDEREETAHVARHLLLAGQPPETFRKTLSFGSSLLGDDLRSTTTLDTDYRDAFPHFVRNARRVWFREPLSAAQASAQRGPEGPSCLGVDAAHLLSRADLQEIAGPSAEADAGSACIHFGRVAADLGPSARLTGMLTKAAGLTPTWLPWFGPGAPAAATFQEAIPDLRVDAGARSYEQLLAQLLGSRLVVSDTYHLCLMAWRAGIPAICVGVGAQRPSRPISDKKKELFYLAQGLSPLYLFYEDLADPARHLGIVGEVLAVAQDERYVGAVVESLGRQADAAERDLAATIDACLV